MKTQLKWWGSVQWSFVWQGHVDVENFLFQNSANFVGLNDMSTMDATARKQWWSSSKMRFCMICMFCPNFSVNLKKFKNKNLLKYRYKDWAMIKLSSVFYQILRMQFWIQLFITTCILSIISSVQTSSSKENRSSKYKTQLFDCGVPGKIQVLQIPRNVMMNPSREGWRNCQEYTSWALGLNLSRQNLLRLKLFG